MKCPRCNVSLNAVTLADIKYSVEADKCPSCEGIWFDKGELSRLDKIVEPTLLEIRRIPGEEVQLAALRCPYCLDSPIMKKTEHPRDSKVIIDYCPNCRGVWLDKGELEAIQKENWLLTFGKIFRWLFGND
jgi:uncharacterized protein